eukprot:scaffold5769_cov402-Prasinococcus_capsulatus_cf.AAC.2
MVADARWAARTGAAAAACRGPRVLAAHVQEGTCVDPRAPQTSQRARGRGGGGGPSFVRWACPLHRDRRGRLRSPTMRHNGSSDSKFRRVRFAKGFGQSSPFGPVDEKFTRDDQEPHGPDLFEVLGVGRDSPPEELKKQFRKLALQYHPDKNKDNPGAKQKFQDINKAYNVLADPRKRKYYLETGDIEDIDVSAEDFILVFQQTMQEMMGGSTIRCAAAAWPVRALSRARSRRQGKLTLASARQGHGGGPEPRRAGGHAAVSLPQGALSRGHLSRRHALLLRGPGRDAARGGGAAREGHGGGPARRPRNRARQAGGARGRRLGRGLSQAGLAAQGSAMSQGPQARASRLRTGCGRSGPGRRGGRSDRSRLGQTDGHDARGARLRLPHRTARPWRSARASGPRHSGEAHQHGRERGRPSGHSRAQGAATALRAGRC